MRSQNQASWVMQQVEKLAFWGASRLSNWLRCRASPNWKKLGFSASSNEPLSLGRQGNVAYKADNRKVLENLVQQGFTVDHVSQKSKRVLLPEWTKEIQPFLHNQLSNHTRRAYETDLKHFFLFMEGRLSPSELTSGLRPEHIILYRKHLEEGRLTGKVLEKTTINRKLAVVKSFLNWLRVNSVINQNPAELVKAYPQNQESSLKGFSDDEARCILLAPNLNSRAGSLHSAILHTLLYMGLRKSELTGLRMGDLSEERGVPVLKVRGKGHRVRILPLVANVKIALEAYFHVCRRPKDNPDALVFTPTKNPKNGVLEKRLNPQAITYIVIKYAKKAGVLKRVSPHSCRATCISNALDKKATQRSVQHLAGWSTPLMIQRYDKRREDLHNSAAYLVDYGTEKPTTEAVGTV